MTEKTNIQHEEEYTRDGIVYRITVIREEGGLWGNWTCQTCDVSGSSSKKCSSKDDAVMAAQFNTTMHHGMVHSKENGS